MRQPHLARRAALQVAGWALVGSSVAALIRMRLGVAPFDVLNTGVAARLGIAPGTAAWLDSAAFLAISAALGRRPMAVTVLGVGAVGLVINAALPLIPAWESLPLRASGFALGLCGLYLGACALISSGFGPGPVETLMLALQGRGMSLVRARTLVEAAGAGAGFLLHGGLGPGTLVVVVVAGPMIGFLLPRVQRLAPAA